MSDSSLSLTYGAIVEQDLARDLPHYRVQLATGEKSPWMPALVESGGSSRRNLPLSIGTQVACLMTRLEGIILGAVNCAPNPTASHSDLVDRTEYTDGTVVSYDAQSHQLMIDSVGTVVIQAASHLTIQAPSTTVTTQQTHNGDVAINGNVAISGNLSVSQMTTTGGLVSQGSAGGGTTITGSITVSGGDVVADGISLKGHTHTGDSGGTTGAPQ